MNILHEHNNVQSKMYNCTRFLYSVYKYTRFPHACGDTACINIPGFYMHAEIYNISTQKNRYYFVHSYSVICYSVLVSKMYDHIRFLYVVYKHTRFLHTCRDLPDFYVEKQIRSVLTYKNIILKSRLKILLC